MKKIIYCLIIALLISSCSTQKSLTGLYSRCIGASYTCTQLQLNNNSTFEYFSLSPSLSPIIIKGKWKVIEKKQILLNSDSQPKNPQTKYFARVNPQLKTSIRIQIIGNDNFLENVVVILNTNQQIKKTDNHGIVEFAATKVATIQFQYLALKETLTISNPDFNDFEIVAKDYETTIFPKYFTNKLVTKQQGKMVFEPDENSERFDLKRVSKHEKHW